MATFNRGPDRFQSFGDADPRFTVGGNLPSGDNTTPAQGMGLADVHGLEFGLKAQPRQDQGAFAPVDVEFDQRSETLTRYFNAPAGTESPPDSPNVNPNRDELSYDPFVGGVDAVRLINGDETHALRHGGYDGTHDQRGLYIDVTSSDGATLHGVYGVDGDGHIGIYSNNQAHALLFGDNGQVQNGNAVGSANSIQDDFLGGHHPGVGDVTDVSMTYTDGHHDKTVHDHYSFVAQGDLSESPIIPPHGTLA